LPEDRDFRGRIDAEGDGAAVDAEHPDGDAEARHDYLLVATASEDQHGNVSFRTRW
jgi:hypothetical protein